MSSCTSSHTWCYATVCHLALPHIYDATLLHVVLHFLTYMMSDDVKAMVNQWVFRQSLGPITPIVAFLEELKQLLKQWGKKGYEVLLRSSLEQCKMRNLKKHWVFCWKSHFVPRPSIKRVPSLRVKATCGILMSLRPGTAAIPKLLQVPSVTWCSSLIFLAPALVAWKLSPKCPPWTEFGTTHVKTILLFKISRSQG